MKGVFLLIAIILSATLVHAATIDFSLVKISVDERGEALVSHLISYDSKDGKKVSFKVLDNQNLRVFDSQGTLEFEEKEGIVSFFPNNFVENYGVTIEYTSSALTSKSEGQWAFEMELRPENEFNELKFELALPKNAVLSSHNPQALVFAGEEKLELEWSFENTSKEPLILSAHYFFSQTGIDGFQQNPILLLFLGIIVIILIGGGAGYFYFSKWKKKEPKTVKPKTVVQKPVQEPKQKKEGELSNRQRDLMKLLSENEEKVVKELLKEDNIAQRNLLARTALPKSTLSRAIKKLEVKGLVKVHSVGNTNKIELSEEFREK